MTSLTLILPASVTDNVNTASKSGMLCLEVIYPSVRLTFSDSAGKLTSYDLAKFKRMRVMTADICVLTGSNPSDVLSVCFFGRPQGLGRFLFALAQSGLIVAIQNTTFSVIPLPQFSPTGKFPAANGAVDHIAATDAVLAVQLARYKGHLHAELATALIPYYCREAYSEAMSAIQADRTLNIDTRSIERKHIFKLLAARFRPDWDFDSLLSHAQRQARVDRDLEKEVSRIAATPQFDGELPNSEFVKQIVISARAAGRKPSSSRGNVQIVRTIAEMVQDTAVSERPKMPFRQFVFSCYMVVTDALSQPDPIDWIAGIGKQVLRSVLPVGLMAWLSHRGFDDFEFLQTELWSLYARVNGVVSLWHWLFGERSTQWALGTFAAAQLFLVTTEIFDLGLQNSDQLTAQWLTVSKDMKMETAIKLANYFFCKAKP